MNAILERFGRARVLLPVVHCISMWQTFQAIETAVESGADGVWLINQGGMTRVDVMLAVEKSLVSTPFVGVNLLGLSRSSALDVISTARAGAIGGYWCDDAGIDLDTAPDRGSSAMDTIRQAQRLFCLYFGGVAFKYRQEVPAAVLPMLARNAARCGLDVITTSGLATGEPPTVEKVATMREAIGDHALGIASGITPENVGPFLPLCNAFLVATGVEESFGVFDPVRLRALADAIHGSP